jgi:hypothetical protein
MVASDAEVLLMIERDRLMGGVIGDVDAHLLASAKLSRCDLWSRDIKGGRGWSWQYPGPTV